MITKEQLKIGQKVIFLGADKKEHPGTIVNIVGDIYWVIFDQHDRRFSTHSIPKVISEIVRIRS